jgi:hypothetical protein
LFTEAFVGIDASYKHDSAAICVTAFDQSTQMVRLLAHQVFQPSPEQPIDFELTIESYLLDLKRRFQLRLDDRFHEIGIEKPTSMELEGRW